MYSALIIVGVLLVITTIHAAELVEPSKELVNETRQVQVIPEEVGRSSGGSPAYTPYSGSTGYANGHSLAVPVPVTLKGSHVVLPSPPEQRQYTSDLTGGLAPVLGGGSGLGVSSSYGTPSSGYGAPSSSYGAPSSSYGAPSSSYGAPSSSYADFEDDEEDKGKVALIVLVSVLGGLLLLLLPGYKMLLLLAKALGLTTLASLVSGTGNVSIPIIGREDMKSRSMDWTGSTVLEGFIQLFTDEEIWKQLEGLTQKF